MKKRSPTPQPLWDDLYPMLIVLWRKLLKLPKGPEDRLQTREFRSLIEHLLQHRISSKDISSSEAIGAYFMYEYPLHYAQGLSLLKELPTLPQRVLELGTLGAPFALAALQHGALDVLAIGKQERTLKLGADLCGHLGYPISIEVEGKEYSRSTEKWDLIILAHSLFQTFPTLAQQTTYIQKLLPLLSRDGHLLLVEDSMTEINRTFLKLRDDLVHQGVSIYAPCLWKGECPALKHASSPCFAQRTLINKPWMMKEIQRAAEINLNSLKMSYLILRATPSAQALSNTLYRVVSPAVNTFRGERYFLCGVTGKKTLGTTLKQHPKQSKAFEYIQRGDVLSIEQAVSLEDDLQVTENTLVQLKAPCDKPILS